MGMGNHTAVASDIIVEILRKLPLKSLLRFKSVCKSWQDLISDPMYSLLSQRDLRAIFRVDSAFYTLNPELTFEEIPSPAVDKISCDSDIEFLGSCNGLLLIRTGYSKAIYLWNPTTKECRESPQLSRLRKIYNPLIVPILACGLCFDQSSNDYKSVFIFSRGRVHVSSLRRRIEWTDIRFPYHMSYNQVNKSGVLVNGHLHWVARSENRNIFADMIACFDETTNKFSKLPLPKPHPDSNPDLTYFGVGVLDGCLSLSRYGGKWVVEVLIMKEYGLQDSWSIMFSIKGLCIATPMFLTNYGVLLASNYHIYACNSKDSSSDAIELRSEVIWNCLKMCNDSLVFGKTQYVGFLTFEKTLESAVL